MIVSKAQKEVLRLMLEGWKLMRDRSAEGKCWIFNRKTYKDKTVSVATWYRLYKLGYINTSPELQFPTEDWFLTDKGKKFISYQISKEGKSD